MPPAFLEPRRLDQATSFEIVSDAERAGVRRTQELLLWLGDPLPHWPHDRDDGRLAVPGRDVDQQARDLAASDRLKMLADLLDVPGRNEIDARLDNMPALLDKLVQRRGSSPTIAFPIDHLQHDCWT